MDFVGIVLQVIVILIAFRYVVFIKQTRPLLILLLLLLGHQVLGAARQDHLPIHDVFDLAVPLISGIVLIGLVMRKPALKKREAIYREMFDKNQAVQLLIDPATGSIVDANPAASTFYGYSHAELQTMKINQINTLPPDVIYLEMQQALLEKRHFFFFRHRLASGEVRDVEVSAAPIEVEGQQLLYSIVHDITEKRQAERETRQLIHELDAFAYTAAHDLKAPLSIIMGYAQNLRYEIPPNDLHRDTLIKIEATTQKMGKIIDELLLFARSFEKEVVTFEVLDMGRIVDEVRNRLSPLIEQAKAELMIATAWPEAVGYAAWVEEVWVNFLTNALKYGGTPPRIMLGADSGDNGVVRFWVKDCGQGINEAQQALLFKPFQRLDKNNPESTGLGLWMTRRLIERQGGRVGVSSSPGEGSLFYFTLPKPDAAPAPPEDRLG